VTEWVNEWLNEWMSEVLTAEMSTWMDNKLDAEAYLQKSRRWDKLHGGQSPQDVGQVLGVDGVQGHQSMAAGINQ